jgi:hypothetical protein
VKCDHPSVIEAAWPAEALAITEADRTALAKHRTEIAGNKGRPRSGDKRVIFRRDRDRYIVFLGDDRIGFVRRADNGTWNPEIVNLRGSSMSRAAIILALRSRHCEPYAHSGGAIADRLFLGSWRNRNAPLSCRHGNINHLPIDMISYIMSQMLRVVDRGNEETGGKFR